MGKLGNKRRNRRNKLKLPTSLETIFGVKEVIDSTDTSIRTVDKAQLMLSAPDPTEPRRRVTLIKDTMLEYPELYLEIFVAGDTAVMNDEARFAGMFARAGCKRAASVLEADLVVFGGGSDVCPALYGESKHSTTHFSDVRDSSDMALYMLCLEQGIPMFGVCRGAQFLHVMNGGKLFQDVNNHCGDHAIFDLKKKIRIEKTSSVHHQSVRNNILGGMDILATAALSTKRHKNADSFDIGLSTDVEAFFYRDTCCLGVQGHPEYSNYHFYTKWCLDLIQDYVVTNPDIEFEGSVRRIKQDLRDERTSIITLAAPQNVVLTDCIKELN